MIKLHSDLQKISSDEKVKLLEEFIIRNDGVVAASSYSGKPMPVIASSLQAVLESHVKGTTVNVTIPKSGKCISGTFRLGSYYPLPGVSRTNVICLDLDGGSTHKDPLKNADETLVDISKNILKLGLKAYFEKSMSGSGWHIWIFLDESIDAYKARQIGFHIASGKFEMLNGGYANPKSNRGIEVFPKQNQLGEKDYGNCVWLPWFHQATHGCNEFYVIEGV